MKLYQYFESVNKYDIKRLTNDIYYIDNITQRDVEYIRVTSPDYKIIDFTKIKENNILDEKDIKLINPIVISRRGIVDLNSKPYRNFSDKQVKGLVFLKKITEYREDKFYNKIEDLDRPNICLVKKENYFYCYDNDLIIRDGFIDNEGILFAASFENEGQSYASMMIIGLVANPRINGKNIVYPIAANFSYDKTLFPYHLDAITQNGLSIGAREAWYSFYTKKYPLKPYEPIDDIDNPITNVKFDDNEVFNIVPKKTMEYWNSIKQLYPNYKDQNVFLKKAKKGDFTDWVYKLAPSMINKTDRIVNILIKNHFKSEEYDSLIHKKEQLIEEQISSFFNKMRESRASI